MTTIPTYQVFFLRASGAVSHLGRILLPFSSPPAFFFTFSISRQLASKPPFSIILKSSITPILFKAAEQRHSKATARITPNPDLGTGSHFSISSLYTLSYTIKLFQPPSWNRTPLTFEYRPQNRESPSGNSHSCQRRHPHIPWCKTPDTTKYLARARSRRTGTTGCHTGRPL